MRSKSSQKREKQDLAEVPPERLAAPSPPSDESRDKAVSRKGGGRRHDDTNKTARSLTAPSTIGGLEELAIDAVGPTAPDDLPIGKPNQKDTGKKKSERDKPLSNRSFAQEIDYYNEDDARPGAIPVTGPGPSGSNSSRVADVQQSSDVEDPLASTTETQLAVAAYVTESENDGGAATPIVVAEPAWKRNKWLMVIAGLLVVLIVVVVVVVVVLLSQGGGDDVDTPSPTAPRGDLGPEEPTDPFQPMQPVTNQPVASPLPTTPNPTSIGAAEDFIRTYDLREFHFFGDTFAVAATLEANTVDECLGFCANYEGALYCTNCDGDSCSCYSGVECLVRWGNVNLGLVAVGTLYAKESSVATCGDNLDFCGAFPRDWRCLERNRLSLQDYLLTSSVGGFEFAGSQDSSTERECLQFCSVYDGARYSSNVVGDSCNCFSFNETVTAADRCATPWGPKVDSANFIARGSIFSRGALLSPCDEDFCQQSNDDSYHCFTAHSRRLREVSLTTAGGFDLAESTNNVDSRTECLEFCGSYDGVRYASNVVGDKCLCFSYNDTVVTKCATPWGSGVDTDSVAVGDVYTKDPVGTCDLDICTVQPGGICFTGNTYRLQDFTLTVGGGFEIATSTDDVDSIVDCRAFCAAYDAARYASFVIGHKCVCYQSLASNGTGTTCKTPWGQQVDPDFVAAGTLYSKIPLQTCESDVCSQNSTNQLCFTANIGDHQEFSLSSAGGFDVAMSSDSVDTLADCREFCASYDAGRYASTVIGDACVCYSIQSNSTTSTCKTPWGSLVDADNYVAVGSIFSKQPLTACAADYCSDNSNQQLCFTAHTLSHRDFSLTSAGGFDVATSSDDPASDLECRQFCATYDGVRFASNVVGDSCICYTLNGTTPCATPWGAEINSFDLARGSVYTKQLLSTCTESFCQVQPDDSLCGDAP